MSQWLDMVAENTVGSKTTVDTSGVSLDSITLSGTPAAPSAAGKGTSTDRTMLYLTAAGVVLAALAYFKGR